ncbi:recombinase family protein [Streptomyces sp. NPDC127112]|uniref:recombinase family protein n=1 Tax=Streptomyces sp. NPDC127112 TaxID=3345364 RepID=UPI00362689EB
MARIPRSPAAYLRISKDAEGKRLGVLRQRKDLTALHVSLGWPPPVFYEDNDKSASKGKPRKDYLRMLADVESGVRDGISVYTVDRLTRKRLEYADFMEWLLVKGRTRVPVRTMENDDFDTANGRMVLDVKAAVAVQEADRMAERTKRAMRQKVESGKRATGSRYRPFGFNRDMTPVKEEQKVIAEWYRRMDSGKESMTGLKRYTEGLEVKTVTGSDVWRQKVIHDILLNVRNIGKQWLRYTDPVTGEDVEELVEAEWGAVTSERRFYRVKAIIEGHTNRGHSPVRKYELSGLLTCGRCHHKLYVTKTAKSGGQEHTEECDARYAAKKALGWTGRGQCKRDKCDCPGRLIAKCHAASGGCGKMQRAYAPLLAYVQADAKKRLNRMRSIISAGRGPLVLPGFKREDGVWVAEADSKTVNAEAEGIKERISNLQDAYRKGLVDAEDFYPVLRGLRADLKKEDEKQDKEEAVSAENQALLALLSGDVDTYWDSMTLEERVAFYRDTYEAIECLPREAVGGSHFETSTIRLVPKRQVKVKQAATK